MFFGERVTRETREGEQASLPGSSAETSADSGTRSRVLRSVLADGPVSAAELGRHLDLTPAAVRRHLDALVEEGAVALHEPTAIRRGRGRPARAYVVSEAGHGRLDADYDSLAVEVLRHLSDVAGPQAVTDFAKGRVAALEQRYAAELASVGDDPDARAQSLVTLLTRDGYAASARPVGLGTFSGVQLCQGHCPVQHAAEQFPAFCEAETDAFSRLLGVHVQRLATLAGGDHVCTTFVPTSGLERPTGKTGTPATVAAVATVVAGGVQSPPGAREADQREPAQRHTTTHFPAHPDANALMSLITEEGSRS